MKDMVARQAAKAVLAVVREHTEKAVASVTVRISHDITSGRTDISELAEAIEALASLVEKLVEAE